MELPTEVVEKFYASIEKTNYCWNWLGVLNSGGSPRIKLKGVPHEYSPRRVSLLLAGKTISPKEPVLPTNCRNKLCVNPGHLVFGDEARFWSYVQKLGENDGGCWVWVGQLNEAGYGKITIRKNGKRRSYRAHIYSWELHNNHQVRTNIGMVIMHKCDHPYCVNPDHLSLGTHAENVRDREAKGRSVYVNGERCGRSKLTEQQVKDIRLEYASGISKSVLSRKYKISRRNITAIVERKSWKHVI